MAVSPVYIICPLCYSADIKMTKEGLSEVLSGSAGIHPGNVELNNLQLTCNACGHIFKPDKGKITQEPLPDTGSPVSPAGTGDEELLAMYSGSGYIHAIKYARDKYGLGLKEAKDYVDRLAQAHNVKPAKREGCFIATACYGDYDAPEVIMLRHYRDNVLSRSLPGRLFIRCYYRCSPALAGILSRNRVMRNTVRKYMVQPLVCRLYKRGRFAGPGTP
jgi:hypothetical protein